MRIPAQKISLLEALKICATEKGQGKVYKFWEKVTFESKVIHEIFSMKGLRLGV